MEQIAKDYGPALATKQLVFDVSNPIPRRDGEDFVKKINDAGGAGVASVKMLPGVHVVRAFNAIGSAGLTKAAHRTGEPLGVPITGDDPKAIELASALIKELGFEPVLIGGSAEGQVPGAGHAARRRAYADRDPQDRRGPVVKGIAWALRVASTLSPQDPSASAPGAAARRSGCCSASSRCAPKRCAPSAGAGSTSSRCCRPTTSCGRSATRWAWPAASTTCPGCSPAPWSAWCCSTCRSPTWSRSCRAADSSRSPTASSPLNIILFAMALHLASPDAGGVGRPHLLHLGLGLQSVRGLGVLAAQCRSVQPRAGQAAVRLHRRRRHDRRDRGLGGDRGAWRAMSRRPCCWSGAAVLLEVAVFSVGRLGRLSPVLHHRPGDLAAASADEKPVGGSVLAGIIHAFRSPYLLVGQRLPAALRGDLDLRLFPAGRDREPQLRRPRRADRVLRQHRSRRQLAGPRLAAVLHRPHHRAARRGAGARPAAGAHHGRLRARSPSRRPWA